MKRVLLPVLATIAGSAHAAPVARQSPAPPPAAGAPEAGGEIVVTASPLGRYVGRYAINGTIATVSLTDHGRLTVALTGQPAGKPLRQLSGNAFMADDAGVRLFFEGAGSKAKFLRSQYRGDEVTGIRLPDNIVTEPPPPDQGT
jgi:hypothetical protein